MCSFNVGPKMILVYHIGDWAIIERKSKEISGYHRPNIGHDLERSTFYLAHIPCLEKVIQDDYWEIPSWDTTRKPEIAAYCKYCNIDLDSDNKMLTEEEHNALNAVWEIYVKFK